MFTDLIFYSFATTKRNKLESDISNLKLAFRFDLHLKHSQYDIVDMNSIIDQAMEKNPGPVADARDAEHLRLHITNIFLAFRIFRKKSLVFKHKSLPASDLKNRTSETLLTVFCKKH